VQQVCDNINKTDYVTWTGDLNTTADRTAIMKFIGQFREPASSSNGTKLILLCITI